jgi:hypothetical protein
VLPGCRLRGLVILTFPEALLMKQLAATSAYQCRNAYEVPTPYSSAQHNLESKWVRGLRLHDEFADCFCAADIRLTLPAPNPASRGH